MRFLQIIIKSALIFFLNILVLHAFSQNSLTIHVRDESTNETLTGAVVLISNLGLGSATDADGNTKFDLPNGHHELKVTFIGYEDFVSSFDLPGATTLNVLLKTVIGETEEVIISSTRTNSRLEDLPSKIEVLGIDDMHEENGIKPGNIASILGDLSVIHIQQTSAVSAGSVVRMQGLGGRYTQLLRDGLPLYDGFSGNLSIMQIPPLDLKQVEIVKGSASTLYGGGSISGMINMISKTPADSLEAMATLNRSSLNEANYNGYFAKKFGKIGFNFFISHTNQQEADVNKDGFSDVPKFQNLVIHPRLFFDIGKKTNLILGYSQFDESRIGGDIQVIQDKQDTLHRYFEKNNSTRQTGEIRLDHRLTESFDLHVKSSWSQLQRNYFTNSSNLKGNQLVGYNEVSFLKKWEHQSLVVGANYIHQGFDSLSMTNFSIPTYAFNTLGFFSQLTASLGSKIILEAGLRYDAPSNFKGQVLPRLSMLYKPTSKLSIRLGSGAGYKLPDVFEYLSGQSLLQYSAVGSHPGAEKSFGVNNDIAYHTVIGDKLSVQFDQAFYYSLISPTIGTVPQNNGGEAISLSIIHGQITSIGTDSYLRLTYHPFELYVGYNHTISKQDFGNGQNYFLTYAPQDKAAMTLAVEPGHGFRIGTEASWVANQYDALQQQKPSYWFLAAMIGWQTTHVKFVLNAENLLDYRQSRVEQLYTGTISAPKFNSLWAPIEGKVFNFSVLFVL
jgi:outer membrane receptor for ferrienterochelin and colicins